MTAATQKRERFFANFAWIILLTVVLAFGAKAVFDTDDLPPILWLHHAHAVTMLAWFVLFAVQATLVQRGSYRTHRWLGRLSPIVVLAFFGFALPISLLNWQRMGFALIPTANGVNLILFVGLYLSAIFWRRHTAVHKRLMLYATLSIMGPAFGRIPEIFDMTPVAAVPLILGYQLAPVIHDRLVHGRVHPASWVGFALVLAAVPLILGLSGSPAWAELLHQLLGPGGAAGAADAAGGAI